MFGRPPRACRGLRTRVPPYTPEYSGNHSDIIRGLLAAEANPLVDQIIAEHDATRTAVASTTGAGALRRKYGCIVLGKMTFFGLYAFGEEMQEIDFELLQGKLSGLVGPNFCGKSSVVLILIYALYDVCPLMTKKCMVHIGSKKGGKVQLEFTVDGKHGKITKTISKSGTSKYSFEFDGAPIAPGGSIVMIKAEIERVVGQFNDNSSIQLQGCEGAGFINAKPAERKRILEQFYERDDDFGAMLKHASRKHIEANASLQTMHEVIGSRDDAAQLSEQIAMLESELYKLQEDYVSSTNEHVCKRSKHELCPSCGFVLDGEGEDIKELQLHMIATNEKIANLQGQIAEIKPRLALLSKNLDRMDEIATRCQVLKTYKHLLGPDGISSVILNSIENEFINQTNKHLKDLGATFQIITKGGFDLRLENSVPLMGASGYQKFVMGIAVRLTLWKVQPIVDAFIIDEGFGACDSENIEMVGQAMTNLSGAEGVPSVVFVISHNEEIKNRIVMPGLTF